MMNAKEKDEVARQREFIETVGQKEERKLKARRREGPPAWVGLSMLGMVGWTVTIPTLIGIFIGLWLDVRYPGRPSWTLTLMMVGLVIGCVSAWLWIKRESRGD